jgi:hypothetical protein
MDSSREIENLIATYAFLVDDGDFGGLGDLLADAEFQLNGGPVAHGRDDVETLAGDTLRTYDDGTLSARHVTTNLIIEVDEAAGSATGRSYYTVFQARPDFPLQPIAAGRYSDSFARRDGRWRFVARKVTTALAGDTSHHVRAR